MCVSDKVGSLKVEFFELDGDFRKTLILAILFDRWRIFFLVKSAKTQRKKVKRARDVRAVGCVSLVRKSRVSAEKSGKAYLRKLSVQEESRENRDREAKK